MIEAPEDYAGPRFSDCPFNLIFKDPDDFLKEDLFKAHERLFEEIFEDHSKRAQLLPYLSSADQLLIKVQYHKIFLKMQSYHKASLAKFRADSSINFFDLAHEMGDEEKIQRRLKIILPLLNKDPRTRPDVTEVLSLMVDGIRRAL